MTDKRVFTKDFKEGVVRFVVEGGRVVTEVNRELDIHQNVIFKRVQTESVQKTSVRKRKCS